MTRATRKLAEAAKSGHLKESEVSFTGRELRKRVILSKIGHSGEAGGQPLHSALPSRGPDDQDFWGEETLRLPSLAGRQRRHPLHLCPLAGVLIVAFVGRDILLPGFLNVQRFLYIHNPQYEWNTYSLYRKA